MRQHFHTTRDKDDDLHSGRGRGRGLYANVDQSSLSGCCHVTALDQSGRLSLKYPNYTTCTFFDFASLA